MSEELLTIGDLARRTRVAPSALRYYEEVGLLSPTGRRSGQRRYAPEAVETVGVIVLLQDVGFTLRQMTELLASRTASPASWRQFVSSKLSELDERIAKAQVARTALDHALHCRHDDIFDCPRFSQVVSARAAGTPLEDTHRSGGSLAH